VSVSVCRVQFEARDRGRVSPKQLAAIERWRPIILGIALEEMNHLTLVSNITVAIGGSPNFIRPNFPASPGYYPADLIIELAPFDLGTLDHFIYLERPATREEVEDGASFPHHEHYVRHAPTGALMPNDGDYTTVGALYRGIRDALENLCDRAGEQAFFGGGTARQVGPLDSTLPGLTLVTDKASALRALDTIVVQGEGALTVEGSHFARFCSIRAEYLELLKEDPSFTPGRPVARNPVMRKPVSPEGRVWIQQPLTARFLDLANALYAYMLRILVQVFTLEGRGAASKRAMIETSVDTMHALAAIAETLTYMVADDALPGVRGGVTFAMVRSLAPLDSRSEKALLSERLGHIMERFTELQSALERDSSAGSPPATCIEQLTRAGALIERCRARLGSTSFAGAPEATPSEAPRLSTASPAQPSGSTNREVARGKSLSLTFDAQRCIHSRHCVTELPHVFRANTPGTWLFPDEADPELLSAVVRECPSGALQYERLDGGSPEPPPPVNLIRLYENGPYAVLANLDLGGHNVGYRATLCRCGRSKNKPFCDHSHVAAGFQASGEPASLETSALAERGNTLRIDPERNGPLAVTGNLELCAGTGRVILRSVATQLCRCGESKNKPLCDGSHVGAGFISEEADSGDRAGNRPPTN
jgi:CDGSH-type Zn-finger protein/uncharacterized Fe-S cluster protein YjdI